MNTGYLFDEIFLQHQPGEDHPESPQRLLAIDQALRAMPFFPELIRLPVRQATFKELNLIHHQKYVELAERECAAGRSSLSTGDSDICPESFQVALNAAGSVLAAVDAVFAGTIGRAFCAVRPPGHHAGPERGMGFCLFNNVALAARYAQKKHGVKRVLIADWDVHHGNGTQDVFYRDGSVLYFSTHLFPHYPGTGAATECGLGAAKGLIINRPFPHGAGNREIVGAFRDTLLPAARAFKPDFTLISAGFDSRKNDPLGGFRVDDDGFRELTRIMLNIAAISGKGRLVSVLEGGYDLAGLAAAVCAHLDELQHGD
ncbi:MAG: histone deacetylase [Candidatus Aminicenantes bacterium]|nr:histone deacetylase [Candidatus Aminicenantes bacterium]